MRLARFLILSLLLAPLPVNAGTAEEKFEKLLRKTTIDVDAVPEDLAKAKVACGCRETLPPEAGVLVRERVESGNVRFVVRCIRLFFDETTGALQSFIGCNDWQLLAK